MSNFPCAADLTFQARHLPRWANALPQATTIDSVINAHAQARLTRGELAAHNLLAIVAGKRRRGEDLEAFLALMVTRPECASNPEKRAAFAKKWLARIRKVSPMKHFLIDEGQTNALEAVANRLHFASRLDEDEMRNLGHALAAVILVVRQNEVPAERESGDAIGKLVDYRA